MRRGRLDFVEFEAIPEVAPLEGRRVVRLPADLSARLPSRGMVIARTGTHWLALEPDGRGSHWFLVPEGAQIQGPIRLEIAQSWPEPEVPLDLRAMLTGGAEQVWQTLTPAARWDWIRWVEQAKAAPTRLKRINSIPSRLAAGKRRPCCFDRNQCTLSPIAVRDQG